MPAEKEWPEYLTNEFVESVEERAGMGSRAWDCIDPKEIIDAAIEEYLTWLEESA